MLAAAHHPIVEALRFVTMVAVDFAFVCTSEWKFASAWNKILCARFACENLSGEK